MKEYTPKIPKKITPRYLENVALYYLQRYASSSQNLKAVLMRRAVKSCRHHDMPLIDAEMMIDQMIQKYENVKILDDQKYCEQIITSLRQRGFSKQAIINKLKMKKLSTLQINDALSHFDQENADQNIEWESALKFAKKRKLGAFRTKETSDKKTQDLKDIAKLARAGFSYDICQKIIKLDESTLGDF